MKVLVKQSVEIDGRELKLNGHGHPGTFNVPGYFIFIEYFVLFFKSKLIEILEVSDSDFENLPEQYQHLEPDQAIIDCLGKFQDELEGKDSEDDLDSEELEGNNGEEEHSDSVDSPVSSNEADSTSPTESESVKEEIEVNEEAEISEAKEEEHSEEAEEVKEESEADKIKAEIAQLKDKAKRLTNTEKQRLKFLETKLKRV